MTSAATFYIAELYFNFNRALVESERPTDLNPLEKEQYELAIEEQAYPFEEKAIQIHEKNLEYLTLGIFSSWIEKSFEKLAKLIPARYAKYEESSGYIASIDKIDYAPLINPVPILIKVEAPIVVVPVQQVVVPEPVAAPVPVQEVSKPVEENKPATGKKQRITGSGLNTVSLTKLIIYKSIGYCYFSCEILLKLTVLRPDPHVLTYFISSIIINISAPADWAEVQVSIISIINIYR